jgi:hypothetical protein
MNVLFINGMSIFLRNPFPLRVRLLYLYEYSCIECGSNQNLELNHIFGRESSSAFNASLLCRKCHSHVGHSQEEHKRLFWKNMAFLVRMRYEPIEEDWDLLRKYPYLLIGHDFEEFRMRK